MATPKKKAPSRKPPKNPAVAAAVRLIVQELGKKNVSKAALKTIYKAADKGASQVVRATDKAGAQMGMAKQGGRRAVQEMQKRNKDVKNKINDLKQNSRLQGNPKIKKQVESKINALRKQIK